MWSEAVDDETLRLLDPADRWYFVAILCLKCQGTLEGKDPQLIHKKVAIKLGITEEEASALQKRFIAFHLVNSRWQPKNWDKRQFRSDSSTSRVQQFRKRQRNVSVTPSESESESDTDSKKATDVAFRSPEWRQEGHRLWPQVKAAIRDADARKPFVEGTDVYRIVGELGGWMQLGAVPAHLTGQTEQRFINAYVALKERTHAA